MIQLTSEDDYRRDCRNVNHCQRTFFTRTIKLNLLLKWLLGSNLSQKTKQLPGPVFTGISEKKPLQDQGSGGDNSDHYWCIKGISESLPRVDSPIPPVDTSWSVWSRITDPDPDLPKRTRSKVSSYICTASVTKANVHTEQDWKTQLDSTLISLNYPPQTDLSPNVLQRINLIKLPALRFSMDGKHFEEGTFKKGWRQYKDHCVFS